MTDDKTRQAMRDAILPAVLHALSGTTVDGFGMRRATTANLRHARSVCRNIVIALNNAGLMPETTGSTGALPEE